LNVRANTKGHARSAAAAGPSREALANHDVQGLITDWNRSAERLFGYSAEEAIGQHISLLAPRDRYDDSAEILAEVVRGNAIEHFQTERRHKDGSLLHVYLSVSPRHSLQGDIIGAAMTIREIAKQPPDETQHGLLAAIVSSSDDAIISKDLNGIITSWNHSAEKLLGYSADEAIGHPITLIAVPGREEDMLRILQRIKRGERVEHYETQRRHKDGSIIDISLTVSPIYSEDGKIIGASKIARDIRERRRADERLRLLTSELDHRAKNVLAVVQAMLRLTRADTLSSFITAVEGRIRALARVHSQVAENRWDGAELLALANSALETFGDGEGRLVISGPTLWVSPAAAQVLGVLLHELATNAAKHGSLSVSDGSVEVLWSIQANGDLHLAWVERNGPKISTPKRRSFGSQVIERNIPDQLGGKADIKWLPAGLRCEFVIPASYVVQLHQRLEKHAAATLAQREKFAG
jgi:PAS domain S-box-containing protein